MPRVMPLSMRGDSPPIAARYSKKQIPKALKEQVWLHHVGESFSSKCKTPWCKNTITVFDYHTSHIVPEVSGGPLTLENLIPLCSKCNLSMATMQFQQWADMVAPVQVPVVEKSRKGWCCF